jgi:hypothetical protein
MFQNDAPNKPSIGMRMEDETEKGKRLDNRTLAIWKSACLRGLWSCFIAADQFAPFVHTNDPAPLYSVMKIHHAKHSAIIDDHQSHYTLHTDFQSRKNVVDAMRSRHALRYSLKRASMQQCSDRAGRLQERQQRHAGLLRTGTETRRDR